METESNKTHKVDSVKAYLLLSLAKFWLHTKSWAIKKMSTMPLILWHKRIRSFFLNSIIIIFPWLVLARGFIWWGKKKKIQFNSLISHLKWKFYGWEESERNSCLCGSRYFLTWTQLKGPKKWTQICFSVFSCILSKQVLLDSPPERFLLHIPPWEYVNWELN